MAPKGNKHAVGNNGGRPPIYNLEKEAEDLLKWADSPKAMNLYEFVFHKPYLAEHLGQFAKRNTVFASALRKAKNNIALNRENACSNGTMNYGVWNRSARLYDTLLNEKENSDKEEELDRRNRAIDYEIKRKMEMDRKTGMPPNDDKLSTLIDDVKSMKEQLISIKIVD